MARKVNQQLRETWRKRIGQQRKSGQIVAEFCRHEGVSTANFYQWKRKLRERRPPQAKRATPRRKTGSLSRRQDKTSTPPTSTPFVQLPLPVAPACPWIEVVLAEGTIIRLPQQNLAALQTVLGTLGNGAPSPSITYHPGRRSGRIGDAQRRQRHPARLRRQHHGIWHGRHAR